ncbi:hypothetical protein DL546_002549 [Coniochaeta pulveracea]|uniref:Uncharacterized protein n=1 Tax=Coniochaeta pulveracea TaxID=177199 RepID=A0A420XX80_9PEZI|nr:hypothetical protein DL546_002549 [Coniochaeta pulveracea]
MIKPNPAPRDSCPKPRVLNIATSKLSLILGTWSAQNAADGLDAWKDLADCALVLLNRASASAQLLRSETGRGLGLTQPRSC